MKWPALAIDGVEVIDAHGVENGAGNVFGANGIVGGILGAANRDRLLHGKPVRGLRQVDLASTTNQANRRLTMLRKEAGQARTRRVNKIRHMLRRHNLQWEALA